MTTTETAIHTRAILANLSISSWGARKYDKPVTAKANALYNASAESGRYNKMLLPGDAKEYKAVIAFLGSVRVTHYSHTLAWSDEGWRLLPVDNHDTYTRWFRSAQSQFDDLYRVFEYAYPSLRATAERCLNGMYNDADYPKASDLRDKFKMAVNYAPVPAEGDIRVSLASDQVQVIEQSIRERVEASTRLAMNDAWTRLHDCVSHIAERLSDPEAIFRDSLITNAREVCAALKRLNVTNDPQLETMRARVEKDLVSWTPETLRDNKGARQSTANKAMEIVDAMRGLYGEA